MPACARSTSAIRISREVGYFIPPITEATDKRCIKVDGKDHCKIAIQSNNVETDDRGYIYVVDRANTGLHIPGSDRRGARDCGDQVMIVIPDAPEARSGIHLSAV